MQIKTYPEMNKQIKDILRISEEAVDLYAAQRIEELEAEVERLKAGNAQVVDAANAGYEKLVEALRWYAEPTNWEYKTSYLDQDAPVLDDCGQRARDVLVKLGLGGERDASRA